MVFDYAMGCTRLEHAVQIRRRTEVVAHLWNTFERAAVDFEAEPMSMSIPQAFWAGFTVLYDALIMSLPVIAFIAGILTSMLAVVAVLVLVVSAWQHARELWKQRGGSDEDK